MNIRSAELLQNALQNTAENLLRNREIRQTGQLEAQRIAVDNAFRQAQMAHYNQMENRQQDFYNRQQQGEQDRATIEAQNTQRLLQGQGMAQKQGILKVIMQLNATGQLSPAGLKLTNHWLSTDPTMSTTGIQLQAPANPSKNPQHVQSALAQGMDMLQQFRQMAASATDPDSKAQYTKYADDLEQAITHDREGEIDTTRDATGNLVRTTTRTPMTGAAGGTGAVTASDDESGDDASGANAPALPAPLPNGTNSPVTLTPQDLTPVPSMAAAPAAQSVAQVSKPAVSPISKSAGLPNADPARFIPNPQSNAATQTVAVRRPDGTITKIPAAHLKAALQSGYTQLTQ